MAADGARCTERRQRLAVQRNLQAASVSGPHLHAGPVGHLINLARFQRSREQYGAVGVTHLNPALGNGVQDNPR